MACLATMALWDIILTEWATTLTEWVMAWATEWAVIVVTTHIALCIVAAVIITHTIITALAVTPIMGHVLRTRAVTVQPHQTDQEVRVKQGLQHLHHILRTQ